MRRMLLLSALAAALLAATPTRADEGLVVIANAPLRGIDADVIKRIYTGRMIEIDGLVLRPINLAQGQPLRRRFLAGVLQQGDDDYVAYWTVRRYVGKGAPPRELPDAAQVIAAVRSTPGAIGYIDAADLRPGLNIVFRR